MAQRIVSFNDGDCIIKAGERHQRMYIILEGSVEIAIDEGMKSVVLAKLKKNDFFGEISLIHNIPRSASAFSKGPSKLTYIDSLAELEKVMEKNPVYTRMMVIELTKRLAETDRILRSELGGRSKAAIANFTW
ncbi:MAG TPA: cyclic nucleotide-binding domain-containing protein [Spirochaetota bacterium]|nr:cyclic nucleotide-binding domain-containing protein [Spirochaetota bacterium]